MTIEAPSLGALRRLVRGELNRNEAIRVREWLIEVSDPDMPKLIGWLVEEARQERLDAERSKPVRELGRRFLSLVEDGAASLNSVSQLPRANALLMLGSSQENHGGFGVVIDDAELSKLTLRYTAQHESRSTRLYATTDLGDFHEHPKSGDVVRQLEWLWKLEPDEGRVTFWAIECAEPSSVAVSDTSSLKSLLAAVKNDVSFHVDAFRVNLDLEAEKEL
jgi:hypothetical protein